MVFQTTRLEFSNANYSSMLLHAILLDLAVHTAGDRFVGIVENPQRNPHPNRIEEEQVEPSEHPIGSVEVRTAAQPFLAKVSKFSRTTQGDCLTGTNVIHPP
jgi:hypothetical protein